MGSNNLRTKTVSLALSKCQQNKIFELHNMAFKRDQYGQELYAFLMALVEGDQINLETADELYLLSVDWHKCLLI